MYSPILVTRQKFLRNFRSRSNLCVSLGTVFLNCIVRAYIVSVHSTLFFNKVAVPDRSFLSITSCISL